MKTFTINASRPYKLLQVCSLALIRLVLCRQLQEARNHVALAFDQVMSLEKQCLACSRIHILTRLREIEAHLVKAERALTQFNEPEMFPLRDCQGLVFLLYLQLFKLI
jgi:hypothetical protein